MGTIPTTASNLFFFFFKQQTEKISHYSWRTHLLAKEPNIFSPKLLETKNITGPSEIKLLLSVCLVRE